MQWAAERTNNELNHTNNLNTWKENFKRQKVYNK